MGMYSIGSFINRPSVRARMNVCARVLEYLQVGESSAERPVYPAARVHAPVRV